MLDHLGHGVGLAGTGHSQQNLVLLAIEKSSDEGCNCGWLVALGLVAAD